MKTLAATLIAAALTLPASAALAQDATITFEFNPGARTGAVMVALYDSAAAYDRDGRPVRTGMAQVGRGPATVTFEGLPAGDYAMKAFHDVNGDGEMNTNPFGMPVEPFAFSNNAVGNMGPARWDRARFAASGAVTQSIDIR